MGVPLRNLYGRSWDHQKDDSLQWGDVDRALLQEIRDALNRIAARLDCGSFLAMPTRLAEIERNTNPRRLRRLALERRRRAGARRGRK